MIIDELPMGTVLMFAFTTLISWSFQLPGFFLTYLLHGMHAGRFGSLAGLRYTSADSKKKKRINDSTGLMIPLNVLRRIRASSREAGCEPGKRKGNGTRGDERGNTKAVERRLWIESVRGVDVFNRQTHELGEMSGNRHEGRERKRDDEAT
jgi:Protein of unknown function (DUF2370)